MKTHTFLLKILSWDEAKMGFEDGDTECLDMKQLKEKMNSHKKFEGKTKNGFKNCPYCAKHAFFAVEVSHQIVARYTRQNTPSQKFWKIC